MTFIKNERGNGKIGNTSERGPRQLECLQLCLIPRKRPALVL